MSSEPLEHFPGGVLVDGETVVATLGERGANGWLYSTPRRGSVLSVR